MDCTNQQPPQRGGAVPNFVWVGLKWLLVFLRVPVIPGTPLTQTIFSPCSPLNSRRIARSLFKICRSSLFSCLSLARLLILLLLLMSGNVHPNPCPTFLCSVCAGNVTWLGRSEQCCTCFNWAHLKCSLLFFSRFRTFGSSYSWSFPLCCVPAFFGVPTPTSTVSSAISCSLSSFISCIHSYLFSDWRHTVSSKFFDTQVQSFFTEELVLLRHARCVLSRLRCNGHSLLLSSYLSKIGGIENPFCSSCGHPFQDTYHFILLCPATDFLRRSLFGNFLSLYELWSRPWAVSQLLGPHGLPPSTHPSERVG